MQALPGHKLGDVGGCVQLGRFEGALSSPARDRIITGMFQAVQKFKAGENCL